jgi:hypothetical protein
MPLTIATTGLRERRIASKGTISLPNAAAAAMPSGVSS